MPTNVTVVGAPMENPVVAAAAAVSSSNPGFEQQILVDQDIDREEQAHKLRILLPSVPQFLIPVPYMFIDNEAKMLLRLFNEVNNKSGLNLRASDFSVEMHVSISDIRQPAFVPIAQATSDPKPLFNFYYWASGSKLRFIPKPKRRRHRDAFAKPCLTMRAVPLSAVSAFDKLYAGSDSRRKQDLLMSPFVIKGTGTRDKDDGAEIDGRCARLRTGGLEREMWNKREQDIDPECDYEVFYLPLPRPDAGWHERKRIVLRGKHLQRNELQCKPGRSYVEHVMCSQHQMRRKNNRKSRAPKLNAGAPDVMVSYSWKFDWRYLIAYLRSHFSDNSQERPKRPSRSYSFTCPRMVACFGCASAGQMRGRRRGGHSRSPEPRVWLDILACSQLDIEDGNMQEIKMLPDVVNFAGKTVVMPGVVSRLWCIYEFAWSIECNGCNLFYGSIFDSCTSRSQRGLTASDDSNGQGSCKIVSISTSRGLAEAVSLLLASDKRRLREPDNRVFMSQASCWDRRDASFIRRTIAERLGGTDQVASIVKRRFRGAVGLRHLTLTESGAGSDLTCPSDREALCHFFDESMGECWKNRTNWLESGKPLNEWYGVYTKKESGGQEAQQSESVDWLDLQSNGIETLGPSLCHLRHLRRVVLDGNPKLRALPEEIGGCSILEELYLSACDLRTLPPSLAKLSQLAILTVGQNSELGTDDADFICTSLPQLVQLDLFFTKLHALPKSLMQMRKLQRLRLQGCKLRSVGDLSSCVELESINLTNNTLLTTAGLESFFRHPPPRLDNIKVMSCGLTKIPQSLLLLVIDQPRQDKAHNFVVNLYGNLCQCPQAHQHRSEIKQDRHHNCMEILVGKRGHKLLEDLRPISKANERLI